MTHRVKYLPLASIKFAAKNPKKHDLDEIQASFVNLGFGEPPLLDERTGRLVAGHGRIEALRALKKAGKRPPQGISNNDKDWLVPVVAGWRSKNDQQAQAYLVASNTLVERGGWCAGLDLSPSYVQATIERWGAMTGMQHKVLR